MLHADRVEATDVVAALLVKINKDYRETRQVSSFTSLGSRRIRDRRPSPPA
jgi:hypothetical protein